MARIAQALGGPDEEGSMTTPEDPQPAGEQVADPQPAAPQPEAGLPAAGEPGPSGSRRRVVAVAAAVVGIVAVAGIVLATRTPAPAPAASAPVPSASAAAASPSPAPSSPAPSASLADAPSASPSPSPSASPIVTAPPGFAVLDGMPVTSDSIGRRLPVAVTIDDNIVARPQYGFNTASIVYQAPADGGETRYMMVFQENDQARVEPVRSGRPFFVDWAAEYRSAFAHYGGDRKTRLVYIPALDGTFIYNVDALGSGASAFHRDLSRVAPHNGVGNTAKIRGIAIKHGAPTQIPEGAGVRAFTDDLPAAQRPAKGSISVPYPRGASSYTYDRATNSYLRSVSGRAQFDAADGKRVTARNVVVLYMSLRYDRVSEPGHGRPVLGHVGKGWALVFHDGHVIRGFWQKDTPTSTTRLILKDGTEIPLVRGRIFFQVVPSGTKVAYTAAG